MKTIIEIITPRIAAQYLLSNTGNRPLRKSHVKWLADQMKINQWQLTHQGICFDSDGRLIDGQHRLAAIVESNVSVQMMVTRGIETGTFDVFDLGIGRTVSDVTHMEKRKTEVLNVLVLSSTEKGLAGKATPSEVIRFNNVFGSACDRLIEFAGTAKRSLSKATVRAAVVLHMTEGDDSVLQKYRSLLMLDFSTMSPSIQALARQLISNSGRGGNMERCHEFIRALHSFKPENSNLSKLQISNPSAHLQAARQRILKLL